MIPPNEETIEKAFHDFDRPRNSRTVRSTEHVLCPIRMLSLVTVIRHAILCSYSACNNIVCHGFGSDTFTVRRNFHIENYYKLWIQTAKPRAQRRLQITPVNRNQICCFAISSPSGLSRCCSICVRRKFAYRYYCLQCSSPLVALEPHMD